MIQEQMLDSPPVLSVRVSRNTDMDGDDEFVHVWFKLVGSSRPVEEDSFYSRRSFQYIEGFFIGMFPRYLTRIGLVPDPRATVDLRYGGKEDL